MTANTFFSNSQSDLLASILDRVIRSNEKMPGAGEIAVDYLDGVVGNSVELKRLFGGGLSQIEISGQVRYSRGFTELTDEQKDAVLRQTEADSPAFFDALVSQTYNGYYTNPRVIELLGLEARPPQPRGHQLEQGDLSLIENVKKRGTMYRGV